jgi:uncharacterized protein (DUF1501 family)
MLRRDFIKYSALAAGFAVLPLGRGAFAMRSPDGGRKKLVVVFLRGAVDGLNVVVPHAEQAYYEARPTIAIARPGSAGGALDLDGRFGLHPALVPLMPMWNEKSLAFIHASGSPDETRSHFEAQDYMESGTPGQRTTQDGWMNRLLASLPGAHAPTQALSVGPVLPRILSGRVSVANMAIGPAASRPLPTDRAELQPVFARMYAGDSALARAYREGQEAHKKLMVDLKADMMEADNGAPSPDAVARYAGRIAGLMRDDPTIQLVFFAAGGWDTHVNQGSSEGQLANHLKPLGAGLAALANGLGPVYDDTVILVVSEFGRTVRENGSGGTDHGHGNVMWAMGGPIAGGKVYGAWPGLGESELHEGRDLAITTDFRSAIGAVLIGHMGLDAGAVARVFPDAPLDGSNVNGLVRV